MPRPSVPPISAPRADESTPPLNRSRLAPLGVELALQRLDQEPAQLARVLGTRLGRFAHPGSRIPVDAGPRRSLRGQLGVAAPRKNRHSLHEGPAIDEARRRALEPSSRSRAGRGGTRPAAGAGSSSTASRRRDLRRRGDAGRGAPSPRRSAPPAPSRPGGSEGTRSRREARPSRSGERSHSSRTSLEPIRARHRASRRSRPSMKAKPLERTRSGSASEPGSGALAAIQPGAGRQTSSKSAPAVSSCSSESRRRGSRSQTAKKFASGGSVKPALVGCSRRRTRRSRTAPPRDPGETAAPTAPWPGIRARPRPRRP